VKLARHDGFSSTIEALKDDLQADRHDTAAIYLAHIPCSFSAAAGASGHADKTEAAGVSSPEELNAVLSEVYAACPRHSMMLVVSQEDISDAKRLFAKKQR
jgi:hypothetical protein